MFSLLVMCFKDSLDVSLPVTGNYRGTAYVKGQYTNRDCMTRLRNDNSRPANVTFTVLYEECEADYDKVSTEKTSNYFVLFIEECEVD